MATRRERVVLELEDRFTTGMARAAASAALLNRELDSLSKDSVRTQRSMSDIDRPVEKFGRSSASSSREVDKLSGRMRILADVAAVLGPSLIPIGAVGVPAITGLASQLGFTAVAAGTAVLAFQGVGTALKDLNAAALNPTRENLDKAQVALESLSPAAQDFVAQIGHMLPELKKLRDVAAEGLFPGLTAGLDSLESALPRVAGIIHAVSTELGTIAADSGASLASDRWAPFLAFIEREAPAALADMSKAAGNTAHALASLWMATDPLNDDFSKWLVEATADIDRWATSLGKTQGFADFVAYVEQTGPKVAAALGAIANAAIQIVQAAAPLGGPVLEGIKALADVVAAIADSDIGTPIFTAAAALALFNRTLAITGSLQKGTFGGAGVASLRGYSTTVRGMTADFRALRIEQARMRDVTKGMVPVPLLRKGSEEAKRLSGNLKAVGKTAAGVAGVGIAASGAADKIGLSNTASLALIGTLGGPWGAAAGAAVGATLDLKSALSGYNDTLGEADRALKTNSRSSHEAALAALQQQAAYLATSNSFKANLIRVRTFVGAHTSGFGSGSAGDDLLSRADALKQALKMDDARAQQALLRDGFLATAAGIDTASQSTQDFQRSLEKLNAVLTGRASLRDYEQALDDFTKRQTQRAKVLDQIRTENANHAASVANSDRDLAAARKSGNKGQIADIQARRAEEARAHAARLKELGVEAETLKNSLNIDTQAGRDTQALLDNIASTALKFAQTLSGAQRAEFLAGARRDFIKAAEAAGMAKDEAKKLADKVLGLSQIKGQPKIVIDADGAWHVIDVTAAKLERLTRRAYKVTIKAQAGAIIPQVLDAQAHASGGTVTGQRAPYGDKVLAILAPGEEVISNRNGQADRHRDLLKAINSNRYADGGTIMPIRSGGNYGNAGQGAPAIDYDRLTQSVLAARPMFGDVHLSGDGSFAREQRQRLSGLDGVRR